MTAKTREAAARRELHEETGVRSIALLGRTTEWIPYDFPEGLPSPKSRKGLEGPASAMVRLPPHRERARST